MRLLESHWYRRDGRFDDPVVIEMRFNQPVRVEDVVAHARAVLTPHDWRRPMLPAEERRRWQEADPEGLQQFDEKVAAVDRIAASTDPVGLRAADATPRWFAAGAHVAVVETTTASPPDAWLTVTLHDLPSPDGLERHPEQSTIVKLEPTFFAFHPCPGCSGYGPLRFTRPVDAGAVAVAVTVEDVTDPAAVRPIAPNPAAADRTGTWPVYAPQPPMTRWRWQIEPHLQAQDGQTLGYRWTTVVDRGQQHEAAIHIIAGHVFEAGRGLELPLLARNITALTEWLVPVSGSSLLPSLRNIDETTLRVARMRG